MSSPFLAISASFVKSDTWSVTRKIARNASSNPMLPTIV